MAAGSAKVELTAASDRTRAMQQVKYRLVNPRQARRSKWAAARCHGAALMTKKPKTINYPAYNDSHLTARPRYYTRRMALLRFSCALRGARKVI